MHLLSPKMVAFVLVAALVQHTATGSAELLQNYKRDCPVVLEHCKKEGFGKNMVAMKYPPGKDYSRKLKRTLLESDQDEQISFENVDWSMECPQALRKCEEELLIGEDLS
ncbi:hypothetical protein BSKO_05630 [Bryopsis sp. KO-2023]|nr:hypothetical protein BSKO_05630 [Bryopsis sp. KO-2023]